jgi:hypothetical protein
MTSRRKTARRLAALDRLARTGRPAPRFVRYEVRAWIVNEDAGTSASHPRAVCASLAYADYLAGRVDEIADGAEVRDLRTGRPVIACDRGGDEAAAARMAADLEALFG